MYIFDAHIDTAMRLFDSPDASLAELKGGHVNLEWLKQGSIKAQIFAVFVPPPMRPMALSAALDMVEALLDNFEKYSDHLELVTKPEHFSQAEQQGKTACLISLEGGEPLQTSIRHLYTFYRLGVRALTLTWNHRNQLADGVGEGKNAKGVSEFGREVIHHMNKLGMLIDVSHLAEKGFWDVVDLSCEPIIASHSNAKTLCDHRRNLTDSQIRALADKGGVIGVNFGASFLTQDEQSTIRDVVEQIKYLSNVGGVEAVGLGSDFDGIGHPPAGLENISQMPKLGDELSKAGFSGEQTAKILGGNFLRVATQVIK